jgi:EAL domain-containing protein (putative c-di-GMP-specific phosphodiesterase class I)/CheY-like chemotaxis protein/GGDEF domain-containing protein
MLEDSDMPKISATGTARVSLLGLENALAGRLSDRLAEQGVVPHRFPTVAGLMLATGTEPIRVLVASTEALPAGHQPERFAQRLERATGVRPDIIYLAPRGFSGPAGATVFHPPYPVDAIAESIVVSLATLPPQPMRVLVVGDSVVQDAACAAVLRQAGIRAERLDGLVDLAETMARLRPHVAVVDLDMASNDSRTPSALIRDCPGYEDMPVVFLYSDANGDGGLDPRRIGGDDYLLKPLGPGQLLAAVRARLEHSVLMSVDLTMDFTSGGSVSGTTMRPGAIGMSRMHFMQRLDQEVAEQPEPGPGRAVIYIEPHGSDETGSASVDLCSEVHRRTLAAVIRGMTGPGDRGAWVNEHGFALWVQRPDDAAVVGLAERIATAVQTMAEREGTERVPSQVSIGIGGFQPPADNAQTLISRAQAACIQAGLGTGSRVRVYQSLETSARARDADGADASEDLILALLRAAVREEAQRGDVLRGEGFRLVYQPILALRRAVQQRYEVLLRLHAPDGVIIPPLTFLPIAERFGLLPELDRWVLKGALQMLRSERDAGRPTQLLIHQTPASMASPEWLGWLRGEILRLDLVRQRPVLEFSARDMLEHEGQARLIFPDLAKLGIEVCLTGVSDDPALFALIGRRPVPCVKLARDLVAKTSGRVLRESVARLHEHGARVIAAGIEDPETIGRVWSSGVDYIQGNFIQFPEDALEFNFTDTPLN